jgi:hypothetical protein
MGSRAFLDLLEKRNRNLCNKYFFIFLIVILTERSKVFSKIIGPSPIQTDLV